MSGITVVSASVPERAEKAETPVAETEAAEENQSASAEQSADENAEASDATETEDSDDGAQESDGDESEDSAEGEKTEQEKPRRKNGFKKRIDKLSKTISAERQEKEFWKSEALKAKQAAPAKAEPVIATRANAEDEPKPEDFDSHADYVKAVTRFELKVQRNADDEKRRNDSIKESNDKLYRAHGDRLKKFIDATPDFKEHMESIEKIPMTLAVQEAILDSEQGPELMYQLAKHPEQYKAICNMTVVKAGVALGKFEEKYVKATAQTNTTTTTRAPAPINPVGASKSSPAKKTIYDRNLSQADYEKLRREQQKRA